MYTQSERWRQLRVNINQRYQILRRIRDFLYKIEGYDSEEPFAEGELIDLVEAAEQLNVKAVRHQAFMLEAIWLRRRFTNGRA